MGYRIQENIHRYERFLSVLEVDARMYIERIDNDLSGNEDFSKGKKSALRNRLDY